MVGACKNFHAVSGHIQAFTRRRRSGSWPTLNLHYGVTQDVMTPGINERCVLLESGVASSSSLNVRDRFGDLPF